MMVVGPLPIGRPPVGRLEKLDVDDGFGHRAYLRAAPPAGAAGPSKTIESLMRGPASDAPHSPLQPHQPLSARAPAAAPLSPGVPSAVLLPIAPPSAPRGPRRPCPFRTASLDGRATQRPSSAASSSPCRGSPELAPIPTLARSEPLSARPQQEQEASRPPSAPPCAETPVEEVASDADAASTSSCRFSPELVLARAPLEAPQLASHAHPPVEEEPLSTDQATSLARRAVDGTSFLQGLQQDLDMWEAKNADLMRTRPISRPVTAGSRSATESPCCSSRGVGRRRSSGATVPVGLRDTPGDPSAEAGPNRSRIGSCPSSPRADWRSSSKDWAAKMLQRKKERGLRSGPPTPRSSRPPSAGAAPVVADGSFQEQPALDVVADAPGE